MEKASVLLPKEMSISPWSLLRLSGFQLANMPSSNNFWKIPRWKMLSLLENLKPKLNMLSDSPCWLPISITFKNSPCSHPTPDRLNQNHWGWGPGFHIFLTTLYDSNRQPRLRNREKKILTIKNRDSTVSFHCQEYSVQALP